MTLYNESLQIFFIAKVCPARTITELMAVRGTTDLPSLVFPLHRHRNIHHMAGCVGVWGKQCWESLMLTSKLISGQVNRIPGKSWCFLLLFTSFSEARFSFLFCLFEFLFGAITDTDIALPYPSPSSLLPLPLNPLALSLVPLSCISFSHLTSALFSLPHSFTKITTHPSLPRPSPLDLNQ